MPDAPDSYFYSHISTLAPSTDNNELAAKLNSPSSLFREGQIVYQNDFRDGLKGISLVETGGIASVYLEDNPSTATGNTVVIQSNNTDEFLGGITRVTNLFDARYFIFSYLFTSDLITTKYVLYNNIVKDGYANYLHVYYNADSNTLQIISTGGNLETITLPQELYIGSDANMRWHIKVDLLTGKYVSIYVNDLLLDISSYDMYRLATSNAERAVIAFYAGKSSGATSKAYLNAMAVAASDN